HRRAAGGALQSRAQARAQAAVAQAADQQADRRGRAGRHDAGAAEALLQRQGACQGRARARPRQEAARQARNREEARLGAREGAAVAAEGLGRRRARPKRSAEGLAMRSIGLAALSLASASPAHAAPCLTVILTGTMSGPVLLNGVAGAGTLVRYGDEANDCSAVRVQFDAGRGTALQLSKLKVDVGSLDAIFFTH